MELQTTEFLMRTCPTCGLDNKLNIPISSEPPAESLTLDNIKSFWSGFFKSKTFFSYYRCLCGLLYCPTFFTETQLNHLYSSMSDNTAGVAIEPLIKTQQSYFKILKKYSSLDKNYMELGPDIGLFTENCLREAKFDSYWLIEPNREVWPSLEKKIGNLPLHLFADLQELSAVPDQSISTVVMIHVLDHLIDPLKILKEIKKKLTPNGILLFVTHDEQSLLAKITKTKWPPFCLQHPQLYNQKSITHLLQETGYQVLTCEKSLNYFPITYLIKHVFYLFGIKKIRLPALNKVQIGLKLGNILTVARNSM